jgi:hypothetical protein
MAIRKRPKRANDPLRPKLGVVANVLAQSMIVYRAFGRDRGFVLMMTGLFVVWSVSLATIFFAKKGAATVLARWRA